MLNLSFVILPVKSAVTEIVFCNLAKLLKLFVLFLILLNSDVVIFLPIDSPNEFPSNYNHNYNFSDIDSDSFDISDNLDMKYSDMLDVDKFDILDMMLIDMFEIDNNYLDYNFHNYQH